MIISKPEAPKLLKERKKIRVEEKKNTGSNNNEINKKHEAFYIKFSIT